MRPAITILMTIGLLIGFLPIQGRGETHAARCGEQSPECKVLICDKQSLQEVREAYKKGALVELLRHTWKDDSHPDDESTPLTPKGTEQAKAIRTGLVKAGLVPSRVQVSSYLRTRQTAAQAIPKRDTQTWDEPATLRKEQCFRNIPVFLRTESRIKGNAVYVTHSSCLFSALYLDRKQNFDPTGEQNYGIMIFLDRKNLQKPIACMWPSDWSLWPKE